MARRVNSELLLVGSLPADSAEFALRSAAGFFGELVSALPDGETGPRAGWVSYEREKLVRPNEGVVTLAETESTSGLPRHAYETPVFGIKPGVSKVRWTPGRASTMPSRPTRCSARCVRLGLFPLGSASRSACRFQPAR